MAASELNFNLIKKKIHAYLDKHTAEMIQSVSFVVNNESAYAKMHLLSDYEALDNDTILCFNYYSKSNSVSVTVVSRHELKASGESLSRAFSEMPVQFVDFTGLNTSDATSFNSLFYRCSDLIEVEFGGIDTHNVTDMSAMFCGCKSLQSLKLEIDTSNVKRLYQTFQYVGVNNNITIDLSQCDFNNVAIADDMFEGSHLDIIKLPKINIDHQLLLRRMFSSLSCNSIEIPMFNCNSDQIEIGGLFSSSEIKILDLSRVKIPNVKSIYEVFRGAHIGKILMPKQKMTNVANIKMAFSDFVLDQQEPFDLRCISSSKITSSDMAFYGASINHVILGEMGIVKKTSGYYGYRRDDVLYDNNIKRIDANLGTILALDNNSSCDIVARIRLD